MADGDAELGNARRRALFAKTNVALGAILEALGAPRDVGVVKAQLVEKIMAAERAVALLGNPESDAAVLAEAEAKIAAEDDEAGAVAGAEMADAMEGRIAALEAGMKFLEARVSGGEMAADGRVKEFSDLLDDLLGRVRALAIVVGTGKGPGTTDELPKVDALGSVDRMTLPV